MSAWPVYTNTHTGLQMKVHDCTDTSGEDWKGKKAIQAAVFFESLDISKAKHILFTQVAGVPDGTEVTALVAAMPNTIIKIFDTTNEREYIVISGTATRIACTGD